MAKKPYKLSAVLCGHSLDVRSLTILPDNSIISGSRDKTAKLWKHNEFGGVGYSESLTYRDQKNFVASVLYIKPSNEFPEGLVLCGGNDKTILIYKPHEPFASFTIMEHTDTVCCLNPGADVNTFLSGSWDKTAKLWSLTNLNSSRTTYSGHLAAVWCVIQLSNNNVVTASADKTIGVWMKDGTRIRTITGHTDCVRGLCDYPDTNQFLSACNDASIKVWSYSGENVTTLYGHSNYIYSVVRNKEDGPCSFVSCDEDRSIRCWDNWDNTQIIRVPAQSVWTLACLHNGDIAVGSSDALIRIFTRNEDRYASEEIMKKYEEEVNALNVQAAQEIGGYKVSDLPGREALYDPGKKDGQILMIRENNGVVAYTWVNDGTNSHWEKIGDVLGGTDKANEGKTMFEGQAYDFVFSVDVEDGKPPLKLPYNKGEDVYVAANNFITKNQLPAIYLDQVVEFILKNSGKVDVAVNNDYVDPFTGGARYTPTVDNNLPRTSGVNMDPFTGGSSYMTNANKQQETQQTAYYPQSSYLSFNTGKPNVIVNKIKEFNEKLSGDLRADDVTIKTIEEICSKSCDNSRIIDELFKLLYWPEDVVFPVIDIVRLAVRHEKNNHLIATKEDGEIMNLLKKYLNNQNQIANNIIVSFRTICNLFLHAAGEELVFKQKLEILELLSTINSNNNKNIEIALTTFLLNLTILLLKRNDEIGLLLLSSIIPDAIVNVKDIEAQFRALVALGTLMSFGSLDIKKNYTYKIKENGHFIDTIKEISNASSTDSMEEKRMLCAKSVYRDLTRYS